MTIDSARSTAHVCQEILGRFHDECLQFKSAEIYLLKLHVGALNEQVALRVDGARTVQSVLKAAHDEFTQELKPHYDSPGDYFLGRSFISLVAAFELFLQDLVTTIVVLNPKKVGQIEFKLSEILDASGSDELVRRGIYATLNKLMYKKPMEYLSDVSDLLSIDPAPLKISWAVFVEAKARRDLGVHNGWNCNSIYIRKVSESGLTSALSEGKSAFPGNTIYLKEVTGNLVNLANSITAAVYEKHSASLSKPLT